MSTPAAAAGPAVTTPSRRAYPDASLSAQAYLADQFRSQQAILAMLFLRQVMRVWGLLNLQDVRSSWPAVEQSLEALVSQQFAVSAQAGNAYYLQARSAAGVTAPAPPQALPVLERQLIRVTLEITGPRALLARVKKAQRADQAVKNTGVVMGGAAMRLVLNGGRQAVLESVGADALAVAWMRVTAADPCSFCSMLASRGPVFKTEASAGFLAHGNCRCTAAPVFSQQAADALRDGDLARQWRDATRGYGGRDALNAWRRYWEQAHPGVPGARKAA